MNRVWTHRDPHSHAAAPAALQPARPDGTPSHEVQALHARAEAYREARLQDQRELAAWRAGLRRLVEMIAPLDLHNRLREQADFAETAPPEAWLAIAEQALAEMRARAPAAPPPAPTAPAAPGWERQRAEPAPAPGPDPGTAPPRVAEPRTAPAPPPPDPRTAPAAPADPADRGTGDLKAPEPKGPGDPGAAGPAADPECPHQGTPWFRHWEGEGSLADNLEHLRARLRTWGIHDRPAVPPSIAWRKGDGWIREMAILCLMAETGMAATRQLALAVTRLAAIGDPFKKAGAQNLDLQALAAKQLIETTQLQVATGKGAVVPLNVAWLTAHGRELIAEHALIKPVENEWQRLDRLHGGASQLKHNSRVMLAASGFRTWGWEVAVLPEVEGAEPDLLVTAPGLTLPWPVEVEAASGSADRRHAKWRAVAGLHPDDSRLCLIAPDPHTLLRLAREIRESAPEARFLCADLRNAFRLPSSLAAARALPPPLLHLAPRDPLQPLKNRARDANAKAARNRPRADGKARKT